MYKSYDNYDRFDFLEKLIDEYGEENIDWKIEDDILIIYQRLKISIPIPYIKFEIVTPKNGEENDKE